MNLFVCVDENLNILSLNFFNSHLGALSKIKQLLNNKVLVFDDEFPDYILCTPPSTRVIYDPEVESKMPDFLSPLFATKDKVVGTKKLLYETLRRLEDENIFILGHKVFKEFLPFINDIYQLNVMQKTSPADKFFDVKDDQVWCLAENSEPLFEDGTTFYFSHFRRKREKTSSNQLEDVKM